jgi:2-oxoglutarate ferredoxin oxidoreductase subunit delta
VSAKRAKNAVAIQIDLKKCTGCGICVEFCHRSVLALIEGHAGIVKPEKCTVCRLCELRCPDVAIIVMDRVERDEKEKKRSATPTR